MRIVWFKVKLESIQKLVNIEAESVSYVNYVAKALTK